MNKDAREHRRKVVQRQPYARPILREFGPVGTLTQGGTGPMTEAQEMNMSMNNRA